MLESRAAREGLAIRRRRECERCHRRFTTFEEVEKPRLFVVKKGGAREEFDREKVLGGLVVACRKRPVSLEQLREAVAGIERDLFDLGVSEVTTDQVGERAIQALLQLDPVAYVRFASVFWRFDSPAAFSETVERLRVLEATLHDQAKNVDKGLLNVAS